MKKIGETVGVAEALNRLQNISSTINNRNAEDEFYFFGLNVASQLRQLPLYEALGVQNEIQAILTAARRRNMYPNLSVLPNTSTQTYNNSALNIQPITSTLSASNTQTNILQSSNSHILSYSNIQPGTCASNYSTLPPSNIQNDADTRNAQSQQDHSQIDLLSEAWKLS